MGTHPIFESDFDCLTDKDFAGMFFGISFRDFLFRLRRNPSDGISFLLFHVCLFGIFNLIIGEEAAIWTRKYLYYHHNFSFFLFANILASLWALALTDASGKRFIYTDENIRLGWELCWRCESYKPHRAHHCYQCRTCILKRDHHCIFAANCVGHANMRYFYTLLFWTWVGLIYANFVNYEFVIRQVTENDAWVLMSFLAPLLAWMINILHEDIVGCILATVALGGVIYTTFLVYLHSKSLRTGVTQSEMNRLKFEYKTTWVANMRDVFGKNWPVAWLSPVIPSPLDQNGTQYPKPSKTKIQTQKRI